MREGEGPKLFYKIEKPYPAGRIPHQKPDYVKYKNDFKKGKPE